MFLTLSCLNITFSFCLLQCSVSVSFSQIPAEKSTTQYLMQVGVQSLYHVLALTACYSFDSFPFSLVFPYSFKARNNRKHVHHPIRCRLYCLSHAYSHIHCLSWSDLFFFYFLARLYSLFLFSHSALHPHTCSSFFFALRGVLWNDSHHFMVQVAVLASLTLSLVSFLFKIIFLTFTTLSHFHQSFSLSITGEQAGDTSTLLLSGWWRVIVIM